MTPEQKKVVRAIEAVGQALYALHDLSRDRETRNVVHCVEFDQALPMSLDEFAYRWMWVAVETQMKLEELEK